MISANPYQAPSASPYTRAELAEDEPSTTIAAAVIAPLRRTRPWARITSLFLYLMGGLATLAGMYLMVSGADTKNPGWMSAIVAVVGVLYFFPAIRLGAYAKSIRQLESSGDAATLETALWHQQAVWRFIGVGASLYLGATLIGVVAVVIAALLRH